MTITQTQFQQLTPAEQKLRWAVFLASDGFNKEISARTITELREKHQVGEHDTDKVEAE